MPDVAAVRTNTYTIPAGYSLYFVVHNLTTSTKNVAVWGDNLSLPSTTTKSLFGEIGDLSPSVYPIMGFLPLFRR